MAIALRTRVREVILIDRDQRRANAVAMDMQLTATPARYQAVLRLRPLLTRRMVATAPAALLQPRPTAAPQPRPARAAGFATAIRRPFSAQSRVET